MRIYFLILLTFLISSATFACSVCKITVNGKTYFGNNEDSWRLGSGIWFEPASSGKFGVAYLGYNQGVPQGGLNEAGLVFDGLTINYTKIRKDRKPDISNPTSFIKEIMQRCHNIDEVVAYASLFRREGLNGALVFFADRSGKYLAMEPDTLIIGIDSNYIIANFCPSNTTEKQREEFGRYSRGKRFMANKTIDENSILPLVDTMHECRAKLGDGSMYSSIADLEKLTLTVYFYHDYKKGKSFNLAEELAKGPHAYDFATIFKGNKEYEQLLAFKTPYNEVRLRFYLLFCAFIFGVSIMWWLWQIRKQQIPKPVATSAIFINILLIPFMYILIRHQGVYYFPAPYKYNSFWIDTLSYLPYAMVVFIPVLMIVVYKNSKMSVMNKLVIGFNLLNYIILIALFVYWGLINF